MSVNVNPELLSHNQVCQLLSIHRTTLYVIIRKGTFPKPIRLSSAKRYRRDEVLRWAESQRSSR